MLHSHPGAGIILLGDFNHLPDADWKSYRLRQLVTPTTLDTSVLEKTYTSVLACEQFSGRHHGIPRKLVNIIRCQDKGTMCTMIHRGRLPEAFQVKTGAMQLRQGCMLSSFLFLLVISWITEQSMDSKGGSVEKA